MLRVRVQPRASREGVDGVQGERLRLRVSAPPVEGAANTAVVRLLAAHLSWPKSAITVTRGAKSRDKDIVLTGAGSRAAELAARLTQGE